MLCFSYGTQKFTRQRQIMMEYLKNELVMLPGPATGFFFQPKASVSLFPNVKASQHRKEKQDPHYIGFQRCGPQRSGKNSGHSGAIDSKPDLLRISSWAGWNLGARKRSVQVWMALCGCEGALRGSLF